jgi:hypothetical protein
MSLLDTIKKSAKSAVQVFSHISQWDSGISHVISSLPKPKIPRIKLKRPAPKAPKAPKEDAPQKNAFAPFVPRKRPNFALALSAILVLLVVSALAALLISRRPQRTTPTPEETVQHVLDAPPLALRRDLMPPEEPALPDDYLLYRTRRSQWEEAEINRWYQAPDEDALRSLHWANERMIGDLLRETP